MYSALLVVHSVVRWAVLGLVIAALARSASALRSGRAYEEGDRKLGGAMLGMIHLQVVLGLVLHLGLSPIVQAAIAAGGAAMRDKVLRFWFVEHLTMGLLVAVIATVVRVRTRKAEGDSNKHRATAMGAGVVLLLIFAMIPWPFRKAVGRSLLPTPMVSAR